MWILKWVLERVGLSVLTRGGWVTMLAIAAAVAVASGIGGYRLSDWQWKAAQSKALKAQLEEQQERTAEYEKAVRARDALQVRLSKITAAYLRDSAALTQLKQEKAHDVATDFDRDNCRLGPDGMQKLACALRPDTCTKDAKPAH